MQKWEYLTKAIKKIDYKGSGWETIDLEDYGKLGWELVTVYPIADVWGASNSGMTSQIVYIFKRPLGENN